jgi:hypothetical protein
VAHHGIVRKPADVQADTVAGVKHRGRALQIERIRHGDVVVEEDDPLPAGQPGQNRMALNALF